ncbi:MAG: histidine--tRNA ligase [Clostridia bacterium]|nr:histidine--tRNA ligase [Clostridia bacterium]
MINIPKGTKDVLPSESYKWHEVERVVRDLKHRYNLHEIKTPMFEHTELFIRGVGKSTDIVNKEMYTFVDKGNRSITLKPEGTAGVARSFIENSLYNEPLPLKLYYITPCFRYERPQAGRLRQHTQFGSEWFGVDSPEADAEILMMASDFYRSFGINPTVLINNLGCAECRKKYVETLKEYFKPHIGDMCPDCGKRFETNPLRILDCKVDECKAINKNAPKITDYLCDDCNSRFNKLKKLLKNANVNYKFEPMLVRGLDYYTNLIFEFIDEDKKLGQNALGGGGRYNNLVEELGGKPMPVIGFGIGIERLLIYLENKGIEVNSDEHLNVYVANACEDLTPVIEITKMLRDNGVSAEMNLTDRSLKAQFKYADKIKAENVLVVGDDELKSGKFTIKNLKESKQTTLTKNELVKYFKG